MCLACSDSNAKTNYDETERRFLQARISGNKKVVLSQTDIVENVYMYNYSLRVNQYTNSCNTRHIPFILWVKKWKKPYTLSTDYSKKSRTNCHVTEAEFSKDRSLLLNTMSLLLKAILTASQTKPLTQSVISEVALKYFSPIEFALFLLWKDARKGRNTEIRLTKIRKRNCFTSKECVRSTSSDHYHTGYVVCIIIFWWLVAFSGISA